MKRLLVLVLVLGVAGQLPASDTTNWLDRVKPPGTVENPGTPDGREGGETIADAFVIPSLPFFDTGNTCDNVDDYDEACPYTDSTAPDVVYAYTPAGNQYMNVDLCYSGYDTKVYVYCESPGGLVACNDDYYFGAPCHVYSSYLNDVPLFGGFTYFIVVDGYGPACGDYALSIEQAVPPPPITCPDDGVHENEPPLVDYYQDNWNGGCNSTPHVFQPIHWHGIDDSCADLCGVSGWYYDFGSYRDTDWFPVTAAGFEMSFEVCAAYACNMYVLNTDCDALVVLYSANTGGFNGCATITWPTNPGQDFWLWVGPEVFWGPVNEFDYLMTVCGHIYDVIPAESTSWGSLKALYRK